MSIPALLWRSYSDGITTWKCLACGKGVHFSCGDVAVLGEDVGRLCTWCGVSWTSVIQKAEATRRTRTYASWGYELECRRRDAANDAYWAGNEPGWFVMRRPSRACDYHDDYFMVDPDDPSTDVTLEDMKWDRLVGPAKDALALLRVCRAQAHRLECPCSYYVVLNRGQ